MKVGIVGHEKKKFTLVGEASAKKMIRDILSANDVDEVVSGGCHLGGIDIWAAEIGREMGLKVTEFIPKVLNWTSGYLPRNMDIARTSDIVYSIVVDVLPKDFVGMKFDLCYHCRRTDHIKSGGCWTMKKAIEMGKKGVVCVIQNR